MKIFLIGAAGGIGRRLTPLLVEDGHEVRGMFRRPEQTDVVVASGATPAPGDLIADSVETIADAMRGCDAIVFSAGAHGTGVDQTTAIDGEGVIKAASAADAVGIDRFVLVSAFPDAGRGRELNAGFEHYMAVKRDADAHLAATDLDYLIVRPGTLTDEPGDGRVAAGIAIPYGRVSRDNVAAFIAEALVRPDLNRVAIEVTDGPTLIADAVEDLVPRRWDGPAD